MEDKIVPVNLKSCSKEEVTECFEKLMVECNKEGANLRMAFNTNLVGQRLVIVFDWEDQGC